MLLSCNKKVAMNLHFDPANDDHDPTEDLLNLNDSDDEVEAEEDS